MTNVEANNMFYSILSSYGPLTAALRGRIYNLRRSDGVDTEECVCINTPWSQHTSPQQGYSNINVHVPDVAVRIEGKEQMQPDLSRLSMLSALVVEALEDANVMGVSLEKAAENIMEETQRREHYNNVRVNWINCNK